MVSDQKNDDLDMDQRIFIKGFPRDTTVNDLKSFFETYGTIKHANIVRDHKSGLAKFGFVTFESKEVRDNLCQEKNLPYKEKTLTIDKAKRQKKSSPDKCSTGPSHDYRRNFPRQSSLDYSSSTAPMAYWNYTVYPFYNQNAVYVPAIQGSPVAQLPSPNYQSGYIPSSHQVFTTLVPGNPGTSLVPNVSSDPFLVMPRTNYVDGYVDYQAFPSVITMPVTPSNDWSSVLPSADGNPFPKEYLPMSSPSVSKGKKSISYSAKEDEESETSHIPIAAVLPSTKEIISQ